MWEAGLEWLCSKMADGSASLFYPGSLERVYRKASFDNLNFVPCAFEVIFFNRRRSKVIFGVSGDTSKMPPKH